MGWGHIFNRTQHSCVYFLKIVHSIGLKQHLSHFPAQTTPPPKKIQKIHKNTQKIAITFHLSVSNITSSSHNNIYSRRINYYEAKDENHKCHPGRWTMISPRPKGFILAWANKQALIFISVLQRVLFWIPFFPKIVRSQLQLFNKIFHLPVFLLKHTHVYHIYDNHILLATVCVG